MWAEINVTPTPANATNCWFPQDSALTELHAAFPYATWVLPLRPVAHWMRSVDDWSQLRSHFVRCDLLDLPEGVGESDDALAAFYFDHAARVRSFVRSHPSLTLVEVDIESEAPRPESVMHSAFGVAEHCWGKSNCHSSCEDLEELSRLRAEDTAAGRDSRAKSQRLESMRGLAASSDRGSRPAEISRPV